MSANRSNTADDLRNRAEALLAKSQDAFHPHDLKSINQLAHELAVHQAELELQNEELRNTQLSLQRARDRFAALFEDAPVGYVVVDASGIIRQTNATWRAMLDRPDEDFGGTPFAEMLQEEDAQVFLSRFRAFFRNPKEKQILVRIKRKTGTPIHVQLEAKPSTLNRGGEDETVHKELMVIVSDISERKRLEDELQQARKMEAVGQLAGGVAHDFNNILQIILMNAELIQNGCISDAFSREAIGEVGKAAQQAADLVRQLLAFSRRQVIQPVNVDMNDLIEGVLKMLRRLIGEHIEVQFVAAETLDTVFVDKGQIEQILMNLCVNARDAMPQGGRLTLETGNAVFDEEYCVNHPWAAEGKYVSVTITDTGCGMDAETCARIFEPFFTTKGVGKGTGLGLSTVYGIVKHHKGLVHVYSELGKGTAFKVYLPAVEGAARQLCANVPQKIAGGSETILVAEDELSVLNLVTLILRSAGYSVLTASDGNEALSVFENHTDSIDLVLLDVMMPGLGGRQVMDKIAAKYPAVRFLFSSGYSENAIHTDFIIQEGLRLIQKPYHRYDLLRTVREILDEGQHTNP